MTIPPPPEPTPEPAPEWAPPPGIGAPLPPLPPPPGYSAWESLGSQPPTPPPPAPRRRGRLIGVVVAAAVLVAGGAVSYVALSSSSHGGASSPQAAVQKIVRDINASDLVGVLDDLAPGERAALVNPIIDDINQLKRTQVLQSGADPSKVAGIGVALTGLTFTGAPVVVNNHVQIVKISGGTVHVTADLAKVPLTKAFLDAAFPNGLPAASTDRTIDIADAIKSAGGQPVRIAAQKVNGAWYPSIAFTIADSAAGHQIPNPSEAAAAHGADSAQAAVEGELRAVLSGDFRTAIALLDPSEMAAVHDYAGLILSSIPANFDLPVSLDSLQLTSTPITGGERESLHSLALHDTQTGETITVTQLPGGCFQSSAAGKTTKTCAADSIDSIISALQSIGLVFDVTATQRQALVDLVSAAEGVGIDTVQSGGQWYVAPARTFLDLTDTVLSNLRNGDIIALVQLFQSALGSH